MPYHLNNRTHCQDTMPQPCTTILLSPCVDYHAGSPLGPVSLHLHYMDGFMRQRCLCYVIKRSCSQHANALVVAMSLLESDAHVVYRTELFFLTSRCHVSDGRLHSEVFTVSFLIERELVKGSSVLLKTTGFAEKLPEDVRALDA
jgi:hypothetical protein